MPEPSQALRLRDMLQACRDIQEHTDGMTATQFGASKMVQQAVLWNLTVIGEAANNLPDEVQEAHLDVPWSAIIGMRHRLVHGYGSIDLQIVWDVVDSGLPLLIPQLRALLAELPEELRDD